MDSNLIYKLNAVNKAAQVVLNQNNKRTKRNEMTSTMDGVSRGKNCNAQHYRASLAV